MERALARSFRASQEGLEKAKKALKLKGCTQDYLAGAANCTRQTVNKFFARKAIEKNLFQAICIELKLEWGDIAELDIEEKQPNKTYVMNKSLQTIQENFSENTLDECGVMQVSNSPEVLNQEQKRTEEERLGYAIAGSVAKADITKLKAIVALLQEITGDTSIKIVDIEKGSIRLILEGSQQGLGQIEAQFKSGLLQEVLGIVIEDVKLVATENLDNDRDTKKTDKQQLVFTIAGNVTEAEITRLKAALIQTSGNEDKTEFNDKSLLIQENPIEQATNQIPNSANIQIEDGVVKSNTAINLPTSTPQWRGNMKVHLDLILLALETLTGIGSEAMLTAAIDLGLESKVPDRVALWRLRQSNPLRKGTEGRKKLDVEDARALVLITCYLAKLHQELIRRAVNLLEQMAENNREPHQAALLGDYIDAFCMTYKERMEDQTSISTDELELTGLALKLLVDLLFYSSPGGHRRLWLALIDSHQDNSQMNQIDTDYTGKSVRTEQAMGASHTPDVRSQSR